MDLCQGGKEDEAEERRGKRGEGEGGGEMIEETGGKGGGEESEP